MFWLLLCLAFSCAASPVLYRRQSPYAPSDLTGPPPKVEWVASYDMAKRAGKIPQIPPSKLLNGNIVYPAEVNMEEACSWTVNGCHNSAIFAQAFAYGGHIGSHSWSHPHMTTLTDEQILGELGWTSQAIYDHSNGLVPKYWRPPYGDADIRVRAIAKEVLGLTLVGWNRDSDDWCLNESGESSCRSEGPSSPETLEEKLLHWVNEISSIGLIGLEHELSAPAIRAFIDTFPKLQESSWDTRCIPDLFGDDWYQNASRNDTATPNLATRPRPFFPIAANDTSS
ncbi:hypothetical protein JCM3774_000427 [Rhodotorula dairenensis]